MIDKVKDFILVYKSLTHNQLVLSWNDLLSTSSSTSSLDTCQYLLELISLLPNADRSSNETLLIEVLTIVLMIDNSIQSLSSSSSIPILINELNSLNSNKIDALLINILTKMVERSIISINDDLCIHILNHSLAKVSNNDISISEIASKLVELCIVKYDVEKFLPLIVSHSQQYLHDTTTYIRYITIMAKTLTFSDRHFDVCLNAGAVTAIFDICRDNSDILAQIVTIELVLNFAYTSHGLQYLFTHGVMSWLIVTACGSQSTRVTSNELLGPTALRLIGEILISSSSRSLIIDLCWFREQSNELMNNFLQAIIMYIDGSEEINRLIGIRALTDLALSSKKGYLMVLSHDSLIQSLLSLLNAKIEVQAVVLHSVARILDQNITEPSSEEKLNIEMTNEYDNETYDHSISEKKLSLLRSIGAAKRMNTISYLIKIAKQPVPEIRLAAYDVLRSIAGQSRGMGIHLLYSSAGFREFIENRETEFSKEGKEAKFSVIETIALSKGFLSADVSDKIDAMIKEGPYFIPLILSDPMTDTL